MTIKELVSTFPDFAKDIKLNYSKVLNEDILNKKQLYGIILICSFTSQLNSLKEAYPDRISGVFGKGLIAALLFKKPGSDEPDHEFPSMVCEKSMQKGVQKGSPK